MPAPWRSLLEAFRSIGRVPGNAGALVLTDALFDHIGIGGGTADGANASAFNGGAGVAVREGGDGSPNATTGNTISRNAVFSNGLAGIATCEIVNDPGDSLESSAPRMVPNSLTTWRLLAVVVSSRWTCKEHGHRGDRVIRRPSGSSLPASNSQATAKIAQLGDTSSGA